METEFDRCHLSDLENKGHNPKINRHSKGPLGKLYTKFQLQYPTEMEFDLCNLSDLENKVTTPKLTGILKGLWGSCIPSFNIWCHAEMEFDFCDVSDLKSGHNTKITCETVAEALHFIRARSALDYFTKLHKNSMWILAEDSIWELKNFLYAKIL